MIKTVLKILILCMFLSSVGSCVKDVDFDQINDIQLTPVFEGSLVFFDLEANKFVEEGSEVSSITDFTRLDALSSSFSVNNLVRADLHFEFVNTIGRSFTLTINLLDGEQQVLRTLQYDIPASSGSQVEIDDTVVFTGANLQQITNLLIMEVEVMLNNGLPQLAETSEGMLAMNSSATLYLEIADEE